MLVARFPEPSPVVSIASMQSKFFDLLGTSAVLPTSEIGVADIAAVALRSLTAPSTADVYALKLKSQSGHSVSTTANT